jgi:hypothetical protein
LHGEVERRTDPLFWGIGPRTPDAERRRYARTVAEAHLAVRLEPWRQSRVEVCLGARCAWFDDEAGGELLDRMTARIPDEFRGYLLARVGDRASLDSRARRAYERLPKSDAVEPLQSGVRLGARVELAGGPRFDDRFGERLALQALLRRGFVVGVSLDLVRRRVLSVRFTFDAVDSLLARGEQLPVTELATLGGQHPLRGFLPGRLLGRTAVSATLEYAWPVWIWLDGVAHYSLGNAFGPALEGGSIGALRQSFGLGLRTTFGGEHRFELLLAGGTRPLDEGGEPESLRFVVGSALDL